MGRKAWTGSTETIKSYKIEQAEEQREWAEQKREAEHAREIESQRGSLWSYIGTGAWLVMGGGPICPTVGEVTGNIAKNVGTWKGKDIEEFKMDTSDVGKWDRADDLANLELLNRQFEQYDEAEFWQGMQGIGSSALDSLKLGGGLDEYGLPTSESLASWSPTKWGGEEILGEIDPLTGEPEVIRPAGKETGELLTSFLYGEG